MSHQEQESAEVNPAPESENHEANGNEKPAAEENRPTVNEQEPICRMKMPQDIRYATEQGDRDKLSEKYGHYQVSDVNTCNMRFVIDYRQKKNLLGGRHDDEEPNLHSIGKTFNLHILPAYQSPPKHAFKVFGTEANVRKCLIDLLNRIFKQPSRSTTQNDSEDRQRSTPTVNNEEATKDNQNSSSDPTSIFVTTINPDSSVTEEKKPIIPSTSDSTEVKDENQEQEQYKFVPLERKPEYTFTMLITGQGQEVLKKNWSFFAGSLQQRLNVTVMNPFKLHKFGDNQWQNELAITGELFENIIDAALQLTAFINDVLGVPNQPYKSDDEYLNNESNNYQRSKMNSNNNSNNDYHHSQRRHEYSNNNNNNNGNYRQSAPQQHQGQSSTFNNNHHERTFFNRGRNNGVYEQVILIRGNCVARIVGTRGSNLRRLQTKCHLRDIVVARHPNENGYVDCTLTAYQTRNLAFAVDTIRGFLRNEDDQAIQILEARYIDLPLQSSSYQNSLQHDQPQLSAPSQNGENSEQYTFNNNNRPQQPTMTFPASSESNSTNREPGFMTRPLHFGNGTQLPQPSYNFRNTPSFDFTHQPTSAARKTDKRPGEINDCTSNPSAGQTRTSSDCQTQNNLGSSSSNSSSVSPRHQSKRTCPETKEIDCTTDEGFWIQKQYYHALDDTSKELFDSLLDKLEKIRIANEENAARKQQRLVGRTRANKSRAYQTSMTHTNGEKDLIKQEEKNEELTHSDEQKEEKDVSQTTTPEITNESN